MQLPYSVVVSFAVNSNSSRTFICDMPACLVADLALQTTLDRCSTLFLSLIAVLSLVNAMCLTGIQYACLQAVG